jgi:hypothetical protein
MRPQGDRRDTQGLRAVAESGVVAEARVHRAHGATQYGRGPLTAAWWWYIMGVEDALR